MKKENNTWNIRRLVDETFVPSAQQTSVLYSRLMDFKIRFLLDFCKSTLYMPKLSICVASLSDKVDLGSKKVLNDLSQTSS